MRSLVGVVFVACGAFCLNGLAGSLGAGGAAPVAYGAGVLACAVGAGLLLVASWRADQARLKE